MEIGSQATSNAIQAPKVTAFEGAHATFLTQGTVTKSIVDGRDPALRGDVKVDLIGKAGPGVTRLKLEAVADAGKLSETRGRISCDLPEGSSVLVNLGSRERKLEDGVLVEETCVMVTPRRIIPEAEEARIGRKPGTAGDRPQAR